MKNDIVRTNVAVIGGAGFLGSHLVDYLIEDRECNVLVIDNLITGLRKHIHPEADFQWFDIRDDERELAAILKGFGAKCVFNYAAEPYIPECFDHPMHFFDINAVSVLRVLNACESLNIPLLQVSSAEIYGDLTGGIKETDPITPHSTYGVSKVAADGLVQVRFRESRVAAIALRQFNCVGPRETHEYVIPEIISQLHTSNVVRLGNNSTRDFLYAKDAVRMAVELLERGRYGEVYNMGSEASITIYDLAKLIANVIGSNIVISTDQTRIRPWEIWHLQSDNSKLWSVIGKRPLTSLRDALIDTVNYFKHNGSKWDW